MRRRGGTPCWVPFSLAVPGFTFPNRFRGVRDLCLSVVEGPSCARLPIYFLIQRQRSPAAPCAPYGGTPCWAVHLVFGCSALAHCSQCDSVVAFLCIVDVEGPVHVRQPVIHMPNVSVHRRRTLCAVRCDALFNAFIFPDFHARKSKISKNRPENRVFGLVEPSRLDFEVGISIFRPIFAVIFGFRGIARSFSVIFLCSRGRRYFTVIFDISDR